MSEQIMLGKDATGAPRPISVDNTGTINTNASLSASSLAINDGTTPTQKLAVDGSGNASVKLNAALPAGTNVIGHVIVDSGTVTANAGTNLNTSALALETGGNLATAATNTGNCATVEGTTADAAVTTNTTGTISGKLRGLVAIFADIWDSTNHLFAQNIKQINGVAPLMGNGTTGTGSQRVTIASDNTAFSVNAVESGTWTVGSNSATGSAVPANAFFLGGQAKTALPTAASDGNLTGATLDKFGRVIVVPETVRDLKNNISGLTLTTTSETTLISAVASTFNDITSIICNNTSATAVRVDFRDSTAGTIQFSLYVPAVDVRGFSGCCFKQGAVNTAWTAQLSGAVTDVRIYGTYVANK